MGEGGGEGVCFVSWNLFHFWSFSNSIMLLVMKRVEILVSEGP